MSSRLHDSSILDRNVLWLHRLLMKKGYGKQRKWSSRVGESSICKILIDCTRAQLLDPNFLNFIDFRQTNDTGNNANEATVQARAQFARPWHFSFAYCIFFKILRIELSPTRGLNFWTRISLISMIFDKQTIREATQMELPCRPELNLQDLDIFLSPTAFSSKSW